MQYGNAPAQSKCNMMSDWKLPESGQSLQYFIVLIKFYLGYNPYSEIILKPHINIYKCHFHQPAPILSCTLKLITPFEEMK